MISGTRRTVRPKLLDLPHRVEPQKRLGTEPRPLGLGLVDPGLFSLPADVVLKLGDQGKDAHDQLAGACAGVDGGIIDHLEGYSLLGQLRDNAVKGLALNAPSGGVW